MARKKTRKKSWGFAPDSQTIDKSIQKFDRYMAKEQWSKAEETLEQLEQRFPANKELLECWLALAYETGDWRTFQLKSTEYTEKYPDEPDGYLNLYSICLQNGYLLLALEAWQKFCEKFPEHPEIQEIQEDIEDIKNTIIPDLIENYDLEEQEALERGTINERGRFFLESNQYEQAEKIFQDLAKIAPEFPPALNNLSLIYSIRGNLTEAIALGQKVIESNPDNFQALGNLVRFYLLSGESELAEKSLQQLKALDNDFLEIWDKKAESLAYFGDWSGLVELEKEAEFFDLPENFNPLFWHCAAVAYANLGQEQKARQLWEQALEIKPDFRDAQDNLENIKLPPSERNTPWAFDVHQWFSTTMAKDMAQMAIEVGEDKENQSSSLAEKLIEKHPAIINLVPILLQRGSPSGRKFAIYTAIFTEKPELIEALKEFAFGKVGTDKERLDVVNQLNQDGFIPSGNVKMWIKGEEKEIMLMAMEINDKPTVMHSKKVQKLADEAIISLRAKLADEAEAILIKALELEPSAPDLKYNLISAYTLQGRKEEAKELLYKIHEEHPDYKFATIMIARHLIDDKELDQAEAMLKPLLQEKEFNYQEYCQLCQAFVVLAVEQKMNDKALAWLNIWKQVADEDDLQLAYWSIRLEDKSSLFKKLLDFSNNVINDN